MPGGSPAQKTCRICGQDCSDRPRVKDGKGRYYCRECAEAAAESRPARPSPLPRVDHAIDLDLDDPDDVPIEPEANAPRPGLVLCPVCGRPLAPDTGRCPACGYDPAKGIDSSSRVPKGRAGAKPAVSCHNCGYDMAGLRSLKCPECGAVRRLPSPASPDTPERPVREALRVPTVCFIVGMLGLTAAGFIMGDPYLPLYTLAQYVITLPIGLLVFYACCLIWIGFDAPFYLNAAALLGTYALADLTGAVVSPLGCFGWIIWMFVYVGVLSQLLDLEVMDAFLVAFITGAVKVAIVLILVYYAVGVF